MREFDPGGRAQPDGDARDRDARASISSSARDERHLIARRPGQRPAVSGRRVLPALLLRALDTLWDYLPATNCRLLDQAGEVDAALERGAALVERRAGEREAEHRFFPPPEQLYLTPAAWRAALVAPSRGRARDARPAGRRAERHPPHGAIVLDQRPQDQAAASAPRDQLRAGRRAGAGAGGARDSAWSSSPAPMPQCQRLARLLETNERRRRRSSGGAVRAQPARRRRLGSGAARRRAAGAVRVVLGHLSEGFRVPDERLVVVTEADVFGESRRRAARRVSVAQLLKSLSELKPEDYVVHLDHGVGIYRGLRHLQVAGTEGDYLHLEYAGGDRLYLPVDRISLVQKYVGADGDVPDARQARRHQLGEGEGQDARDDPRHGQGAARRLRRARDRRAPPRYTPPDAYFREFEATFPFEETPDQKQAIDDVLADLQRGKPMDRLICGDVGYGKTEVALRGGVPRGDGRPPGGRAGADHRPGAAALHHLPPALRGLSGARRDAVALPDAGAAARGAAGRRAPARSTSSSARTACCRPTSSSSTSACWSIDEEHRFGVRTRRRSRTCARWSTSWR